MEEIREMIREYRETLGLGWQIIIRQKEGVPFIHSERGFHFIFVPKNFIDNPGDYRSSWSHEMCHAFLAEKVDPIFSGSLVIGRKSEPDFQRQLKILSFAQLHKEIFVDDVRDERLGRDLTIEAYEKAQSNLLFILEKSQKYQDLSFDSSLFWLLAIQIAQDCRYDLNLHSERLLDFLSRQTKKRVQKVLAIYFKIPEINSEREELLSLLETITQKIVREIFKANFVPKIGERKGKKVWLIESFRGGENERKN